MISSEFYHKHLADKVDGLGAVGTFIRLVGANDLEIPIAGYLEIPIEIFGFSVRASFLVLVFMVIFWHGFTRSPCRSDRQVQ